MKLKLVAFLAIVLVASMASAQVLTGTLQVIVSDAQGGRLPGAVVSASASDSTTPREVVTNSQGEATLQALSPSAMYVVEVKMAGFAPSRNENVLVRSGHTASLQVSLAVAGVAETVTVTSVTPLVDTTSALTGQDITLELTESLPTGRTYQDYLQLVPGVFPDDPRAQGNPASKTGLNYRDIFGDNGVSRDNFYYIDGVNTTDGLQGTFGSNLNTEIIQEQKVLTGGIPAQYVGAPGLISSVVTKSGTNTPPRLRELLLPERQLTGVGHERRVAKLLAIRHRLHSGRTDRDGQSLGLL